MASLQEVLELCRLCLIKDDVNTPIFEDEDDISHVFLKLSACLPIKVSRDDLLPKRICESCFYKLELFYEFLKTCTTSEKQLLSWINPLKISTIPLSKSGSTILLKQEVPELIETDDLNIPSETQDYELQQPYEGVEFEFQQEEFIENESGTNVNEASGEKRKRGVTLETLQDDLDSDDDIRVHSSKHAKTEDDIDSDNDAEETFDEIPSTSGDNDQPGPSGVGKAGTDPPSPSKNGILDDHRIVRYKTEFSYSERDHCSMEQSYSNVDSRNIIQGIRQKYKCLFCPAKFPNIVDLTNHNVLSHHAPKAEGSTDQQKFTLSESDAELNAQATENALSQTNKKWHCQKCSLYFETSAQKKAHQKTHMKAEDDLSHFSQSDAELDTKATENALPKIKKKWHCRKCSLDFETSTKKKAHQKTHRKVEDDMKYCFKYDENQQVYNCHTCDFETSAKEEMETHVIMHEKKFSCTICNMSFKEPYSYSCHVYDHDRSKNFQCPLCQYNTSRRTAISMHINSLHLGKFIYTCQDCGRGFNNRMIFLEHANIHKGIKPFQCIVCNREFAFSSYLTHHQIKVHSVLIEGVVGPNQCSLCFKRFSRNNSLEKHMKHHNVGKTSSVREKKHLCDICGKGFAVKEKMRIHYRVHTGIKPYVCSYCSKGFTKRDYLIMHERTHNGEKPYICKHCGKAFSQGAPLRLHLRIHTGERPYQCHLCSSNFISKPVLNKHLKDCPGF